MPSSDIILGKGGMGSAKVKPPTIAQWVASMETALNNVVKTTSGLITAIVLLQKNPFNYPKTLQKPEIIRQNVFRTIQTLLNVIGQLTSVLLTNGVPKEKVDALVADGMIMLKSTLLGAAMTDSAKFDLLFSDSSYLNTRFSLDITTIKDWVTKNIKPLIK